MIIHRSVIWASDMADGALPGDELVARLAEVFREYGYDGASMARITAATGLGKGSLYHFFPGGKKAMAEAVLAHIDVWFATNVFAPLETAAQPEQAIEAMFDNVERYFHSGRRICLLGSFAMTRARDPFSGRISGYFERWIAALAVALERLGGSEADAKAVMIVASIQGALVTAAATERHAVFATVIEQIKRAIA